MTDYDAERFHATEAIARAKVVDERAVIIRPIEDNPTPSQAFVHLTGYYLRVTYLKPGGVTASCEGKLVMVGDDGVTIRLDDAHRAEHQDEQSGARAISWEDLGLVEVY